MIASNYTELRTNLKELLDKVETDNETVIIKRGTGKGAVMISLEEYNSLLETMHILSSKKNTERLYESLEQVKRGELVNEPLID